LFYRENFDPNEDAIQCLEKMIDLRPNNINGNDLFNLSYLYCITKQIDKAILYMQKVRDLAEPDAFEYLIYLGDLNFEIDPRKAISYYEQSIEILIHYFKDDIKKLKSKISTEFSQNKEIHYFLCEASIIRIFRNMGDLYFTIGNYHKSIENYTLYINNETEFGIDTLRKKLFGALLKLKQYDKAICFILESEKKENNWDRISNLEKQEYNSYIAENLSDEEFEEFISKIPLIKEIFPFLDSITECESTDQRKILLLEKKYIIEKENQIELDFQITYNLLELYKKSGRYGDAIRIAKEISYPSYNEIFNLYLESNDIEGFKKYSEEILKGKWSDDFLQSFYYKCKEKNYMEFFVSSALAAAQRNEDKNQLALLYKYIGFHYYKLENYNLAIEYSEQSYEQKPDLVRLYDIGTCYFKKGNFARTIEYFREVLGTKYSVSFAVNEDPFYLKGMDFQHNKTKISTEKLQKDIIDKKAQKERMEDSSISKTKRFVIGFIHEKKEEFFTLLKKYCDGYDFLFDSKYFLELLLDNIFSGDISSNEKIELYDSLYKIHEYSFQVIHLFDWAICYKVNGELQKAKEKLNNANEKPKYYQFEPINMKSLYYNDVLNRYFLFNNNKKVIEKENLLSAFQILLKEIHYTEERDFQNKQGYLSFLSHTLRNSLSGGTSTIERIIDIGKKAIEADFSKYPEAYNSFTDLNILYSTFNYIESLLDTFKLFTKDESKFIEEWNQRENGEVSPQLLIGYAAKQLLHRVLFAHPFIRIRKKLNKTVSIEVLQQDFLLKIARKEFDENSIEELFIWINNNIPLLQIKVIDSETKWNNYGVKFNLLFSILSEILLNALKYSDGEKPIVLEWKNENNLITINCINTYNTESTKYKDTQSGLKFIKELLEKLKNVEFIPDPKNKNEFKLQLNIKEVNQ
jgi:hypothetical protein